MDDFRFRTTEFYCQITSVFFGVRKVFKRDRHFLSGYTNCYRPLSRRLDRCDRVIQNESRDPFGGNVYYVTMQITFLTRKFRNVERHLHCDIVHITTKWVSSLTLDCNGVFAIKAYGSFRVRSTNFLLNLRDPSDFDEIWHTCR